MCCDSWGRKESDTTERLNRTHIYGIKKSGADEPVCGAGMEVRTWRADLRTRQGRERVGGTESSAET